MALKKRIAVRNKKTELIVVHVTPEVKAALVRAAEARFRKLGPHCFDILRARTEEEARNDA